MIWVLGHVFGMSMFDVPWKPNKGDGEFFLKEITQGGNFSRYGSDGIMESRSEGKIYFFFTRLKRNARFVMHYPNEVLWAPYVLLKTLLLETNYKILI